MEIIKSVSRWGNSAGILLPKEWLGNQVKIIYIERTLEIKKEVIRILYPYFEEVMGIYLVGSYARGEETPTSDIDILVISNSLKKEIISSKYNISIVPLEGLKKTLYGIYPELILPRLLEAKVLLNKNLLEELKKIKVNKASFKAFIEDTERMIKINKGLLDLEEPLKDIKDYASISYSLILRLRGIFLIKSILKNEKYTSKDFKKWICSYLEEESFKKIYKAYSEFKNKEKSKIRIKKESLDKLVILLENEIKGW